MIEQCGFVKIENGVAEICDHEPEIPGRFCVCCEFDAGLVDPHRLFRFMGVPEQVIQGPHLHIADQHGRVIGVAAPISDEPDAEWKIRKS